MTVDNHTRLVFLYLGRGGALGRFCLDLASAVAQSPLNATFVISHDNPIYPELKTAFGEKVVSLETFKRATSAAVITNFFAARRKLLTHLERERPVALVTLMPHIWTPLLAPLVRKLGIRYVTVMHDAFPHPGDPTAFLTRWLRSEARAADLVVTLSRAVADQLLTLRVVSNETIHPLFHPDLSSRGARTNRTRDLAKPFRLLFFGRVMHYKGLPLLIDAIELLQKRGLPVELGVVGLGTLSNCRERLAAIGAEIINRWIADHEIAPIFARYDAVALSHIEASQSGVAATAFGNGMPVIGMPVGGIAEQVIDGKTGVLAHHASASSFADAIQRLASDPGLYSRISAHLNATAKNRSMECFLSEVVSEIRRISKPGQ